MIDYIYWKSYNFYELKASRFFTMTSFYLGERNFYWKMIEREQLASMGEKWNCFLTLPCQSSLEGKNVALKLQEVHFHCSLSFGILDSRGSSETIYHCLSFLFISLNTVYEFHPNCIFSRPLILYLQLSGLDFPFSW